jgi:sorbitol-specific phosphotransferase system component IIA
MDDQSSGPPIHPGAVRRALSPVIGVAMMIVLVVLLSSAITGLVLTFDDSIEVSEFEEMETGDPWEDDPLLGPEDPTAGATDVRYRAYFEIDNLSTEDDSLTDVRIHVNTSEDMFSGTDQSDLETFEIESTNGSTVEISDDVDSWEIEADGSEIEIEIDSSENRSVGDIEHIVIVFDGVDNPVTPGTYDVVVDLNDGGDVQRGEVVIVEE